MEQFRCCVCGRSLKNRESVERGVGPVCAGKYGIEVHPGLGVKFKLQEAVKSCDSCVNWDSLLEECSLFDTPKKHDDGKDCDLYVEITEDMLDREPYKGVD